MNRNYILRDWLGTPRVTLDGSGTVVQATDIDPYGRVMDLRTYVAGAEADRYRFTGHAHDAESGYDYHGARYYQPELGRYLGVDVMAISRAWVSSYNYVQGNPVNRVDPTGMLDGDYYAPDGRHLGNDGIDDDKAYLVEGEGKFLFRDFKAGGKFHGNPSGFAILGDGYSVTDIGMSNSELNTRVFLSLIRTTEGNGVMTDYDSRFGGGKLPNLNQHPHTSVTRWGYTSSASGAYMFLSNTWDRLAKKLGLIDFSEASQDAAGVQQIKDFKALENVKNGEWEVAFDKLAVKSKAWTSLPGGSQSAMSSDQAISWLRCFIGEELIGKSNIRTSSGQLCTD